MTTYIYIYIERERERERDLNSFHMIEHIRQGDGCYYSLLHYRTNCTHDNKRVVVVSHQISPTGCNHGVSTGDHPISRTCIIMFNVQNVYGISCASRVSAAWVPVCMYPLVA